MFLKISLLFCSDTSVLLNIVDQKMHFATKVRTFIGWFLTAFYKDRSYCK